MADPTTKPERAARPGGGVRDFLETVVFILLLVILLRLFSTEAYEIPSGSMAPQLLGGHKDFVAKETGYPNLVNARDEVEGLGPDAGMPGMPPPRVVAAVDQNGRFVDDVSGVPPANGDRVLVSKFLYDLFVDPGRWEVIVFKCPQPGARAENYIKRMLGLPGETVNFHYGDVQSRTDDSGDFRTVPTPPAVVLATRQTVYDNDHPPTVAGLQPRWRDASPGAAGAGWQASADGRSFATAAAPTAVLEYRHLIGGGNRFGDASPQLVTDFLGYNTPNLTSPAQFRAMPWNWVGDLMLEAEVTLRSTDGIFALELGEGARRYRAEFDLVHDKLILTQRSGRRAEEALTATDSPIAGPGTYRIGLANFNDRLTVFVDGVAVPLQNAAGDQIALDPPTADEAGPYPSDLRPALIEARNLDAGVAHLRLYRDIHYSRWPNRSDVDGLHYGALGADSVDLLRDKLRRVMSRDATLEIPPEHYLMLGDNSLQSSDGRVWGTVPRRLIVGRAVCVYWPLTRWRLVR